MATVVITTAAQLAEFLKTGTEGDKPVIADPELGSLTYEERRWLWRPTPPDPPREFVEEKGEGYSMTWDSLEPRKGVAHLNGKTVYFIATDDFASVPAEVFEKAIERMRADPSAPGTEDNPIKLMAASSSGLDLTASGLQKHGETPGKVPFRDKRPTSGCSPATGGDPVGSRLFARYAGQAASRASALDEVTGVSAETYERVVRGLPLEPDPGTGFRDDPARHRSDAADAMAYAMTAHRAPDPRTGFRDDPARPGVRYLDVTRPGDLERRLWWERDLDARCTAFHLRSVTCQGRCAERAYRVADMEAERIVDFRFLAEQVLREFGGELTADAVGRMLADAYPDRGSSLLEGVWKAYALGYDRGRAEAAGEARLEERRSMADGLELWARHARGDTGSAAAVRMLASILRDHDDRRDGPLERRFEQRARYGDPSHNYAGTLYAAYDPAKR